MSVDWLHISTTGACGNGTITITADTYSELDERIAAVVVSSSAYGLTAKTDVIQKYLTITEIVFSGLTWVRDIPASGGTATKDNCSYTVKAKWNDGTIEDITSAATVSGSKVIAASTNTSRHSVGNLTLSASYNGLTTSSPVTVYQEAYIPVITGITFSGLTWIGPDIPASGGTATKANCDYTVKALWSNGTITDITSAATVSGSATIPSSDVTIRHTSGTIQLNATYESFSATDFVSVWQAAKVVYYLYYTSSDSNIVTPYSTSGFGANIVSNTYEGGVGILGFDGPVTSIGRDAFYECTKLTGITIPDSVTTIGRQAFYLCRNLTGITIPDNVISIGDEAFGYCNSLEEIKVNNNNSVYDSRNNCNAIIETSTNKLIKGCKNTIIPNTVTGIGYKSFESCTDLTGITIPDSVIEIGNSAFSDCRRLTGITIPNSVTSIEDYAFLYCSDLTSITVHSTTPPTIGPYCFNGTNDCPIYVPYESVDTYKEADVWWRYASRIQPIP